MQGHISMRPFANDAEELYAVLQRVQGIALATLGWRALAMVGLMAAGMVAPGPYGQVAWCFAALAGVACVCAAADYATRSSLMDLLTLQDLIRPRDEVGAAAIELIQALAEAGVASHAEHGHG